MKPIILQFDDNLKVPLYIQLYRHIKGEILAGEINKGERLPSIRKMADNLSVSVTTIKQAYDQLLVEGYIESRPQSGFYVSSISPVIADNPNTEETPLPIPDQVFEDIDLKYDLSSFSFLKWKKCVARVFNEYAQLLLFESDPQGESVLRFEISKYLFSSRGVSAHPEQIVIGAGTQQLTSHLCRIMKKMDISHISTEDPGYAPLQNVFRDNGFAITKIPVETDGIVIDKLPVNIPSAVYVSPSNQFPTGSVMPVGRRYQLIDWALQNGSYILEDDYDSELRYFGKPVPALASLDKHGRVVYLGSFSSTLFPAIKISYMVLPEEMVEIFESIKADYTQTCSKTEQLSLAFFMEYGYYSTNIKKLRNLYSQKLQVAIDAFSEYADGFVSVSHTNSGISIMLRVKTKKDPALLSKEARALGLNVIPVANLSDIDSPALTFYYSQVPIDELASSIADLSRAWMN